MNSGNEKEQCGAGFLLAPELLGVVREWRAVSDRLVSLTLRILCLSHA
jgi:hypothetical protein